LAVPASSDPAERVFSIATVILTKRRRRLDKDRVARLMILKKNLELYKKIKIKNRSEGYSTWYRRLL
jgi:hypothetical protein